MVDGVAERALQDQGFGGAGGLKRSSVRAWSVGSERQFLAPDALHWLTICAVCLRIDQYLVLLKIQVGKGCLAA
jgi:hypothetical protein